MLGASFKALELMNAVVEGKEENIVHIPLPSQPS